jgi:hypothetical protein
MKNIKSGEMRLVLSSDHTRLLVGMSGFAIALTAHGLETIYTTKLPDAGDEVVNVVSSDEMSVYACNSNISKVDDNGVIQFYRSLTDESRYEVRIAASGKTLYASVDGYAVGLIPMKAA